MQIIICFSPESLDKLENLKWGETVVGFTREAGPRAIPTLINKEDFKITISGAGIVHLTKIHA